MQVVECRNETDTEDDGFVVRSVRVLSRRISFSNLLQWTEPKTSTCPVKIAHLRHEVQRHMGVRPSKIQRARNTAVNGLGLLTNLSLQEVGRA